MTTLSQLAIVGQELNRATDELNAVLQRHQDTLVASKINIEVWLTPERPRQQSARAGCATRTIRMHELGYGRFGKGWAFLIRSCDYQLVRVDGAWELDSPDGIERGRQSLLRSSRSMRVAAAHLFPRLGRCIHDAAAQMAASLHEANQQAIEIANG